jgi:Holliday junction resolvase RusA-like endonuclease
MSSFYKFNEENIDALNKSFIYLFSAKKWEEKGSEFKFSVDIGSDEEYRAYLAENLMVDFNLPRESKEYYEARRKQISILKQHKKDLYLDTPIEFDLLVNILLDEAKSEKGKKERREAIKNEFFIRTGICCFTTDEKTLDNSLHWERFAGYGEGFCVEYNLDILSKYFFDTNSGIVPDYINYYEKEIPTLRNNNRNDLAERIKNYHEIIFSLPQVLNDEKEFRLAKVFRFQLKDADERRKQPVPSESILSLTIGPSMSSANEEKLLKIARKNLPNMELFKIGEQYGIIHKYPIK